MPDRDRCQRYIHRELRLQSMTEIGTGGAHGKVAMLAEKFPLLGGRGVHTGGAGQHRGVAAFDLVFDLVPKPPEACRDGAGLPVGAAGYHGRQSRQRFGAALLGVLARLDHQEGAHRSKRHSAIAATLPDRRIVVFQVDAAELIDDQQVGPLGIL